MNFVSLSNITHSIISAIVIDKLNRFSNTHQISIFLSTNIDMIKCKRIFEDYVAYRFRGVAVITSASHAEGREFEPRRNLFYFFNKNETCYFIFISRTEYQVDRIPAFISFNVQNLRYFSVSFN